jgi:hypothetical protein
MGHQNADFDTFFVAEPGWGMGSGVGAAPRPSHSTDFTNDTIAFMRSKTVLSQPCAASNGGIGRRFMARSYGA